jgi:hypothetical protein
LLLFVTRHGNWSVTIPVERQFLSSNTHRQQEVPRKQQ